MTSARGANLDGATPFSPSSLEVPAPTLNSPTATTPTLAQTSTSQEGLRVAEGAGSREGSVTATSVDQILNPDDGQSDTASVSVPSSFTIGLSVDDDADSAVGDVERPDSTISVSSSVYDFVEEHGRTFHRYKEGKYWLPNDEQEQERLDLQHAITMRIFKGRLALAPIVKPTRVLDIGTGTGMWAIEFAQENPQAKVIGTDLSPIQPYYVPPNCQFEVDDAEDDWTYSQPFDYIHARFMCSAFTSFPKVFKSIYDNLVPGGWVEFQDYYAKLQCIDDSLSGTSLERWNNLLLEGARKMGRNGLAAASYKRQMQEAGFVDVVERKFALPGSPWAKGKEEKILGAMQMQNICDGIHGMSIGLFTKMHGMSTEEVEILLAKTRKDLRDRSIHFYYILLSVYGRKPKSPDEETSSQSPTRQELDDDHKNVGENVPVLSTSPEEASSRSKVDSP